MCLISEIKLDETIPKSQFQIDSCRSIGKNRTCLGGAL